MLAMHHLSTVTAHSSMRRFFMHTDIMLHILTTPRFMVAHVVAFLLLVVTMNA